LLSKHAVDIVRDLQRLDGMEGDYEEGSGSGPGRRKTIRNLEKSRRKMQAINTLDVAFRQRFFNMNEAAGKRGTKYDLQDKDKIGQKKIPNVIFILKNKHSIFE